MERLEIEKKIIDYALKMSAGSVRMINQIAVHCTATKEGVKVIMADIDAWHKDRGFKKQKLSGHYCGYHYVVALDGSIMCGRDLSEVGAHVKNYNTPSIGVCYVGGLDKNGKEKDTRTPEQKAPVPVPVPMSHFPMVLLWCSRSGQVRFQSCCKRGRHSRCLSVHSTYSNQTFSD